MSYQQTSDRSKRPADPANDARYRSSTFKLSEDGIPMRAAPAPLARRFEQICASIIAEVPGIEQWRLAEAVGIDRNSASLVADRLERKRLVKRRINGTDRRARELHITAKGKLAFEVLWQKVRAANARILAPLSAPDQALFINLLIKLIEGNSNHARPGAGRRRRGSGQAQTKREGRQ